MCGIAGLVGEIDSGARDVVGRMIRNLRHRGPDDEGLAIGRQYAFGHTRLSIVDLSANGAQPMSDCSGRFTIVFNGEIYNHSDLRKDLEGAGVTFRGRSDTEVLLHSLIRWGPAAVCRMHGMFSFALWDSERECVTFGRDRAGEKPLYYCIKDGVLAFASELRALLAAEGGRPKVNVQSLVELLRLGFVSSPESIVSGVRKVPPATMICFDGKASELWTWRYWTPPLGFEGWEQKGGFNSDALAHHLERLLLRSVKWQLEADVPTGLLMSGGLDSGLIAALAAQAAGSIVRTYTVTFPGEGRFNESVYARKLARHFGTEHREIEASAREFANLPAILCDLDEPIVDSSSIPTWLVAREIRKNASVALAGDGGDELFGGYTIYNNVVKMKRLIDVLPSATLAAVSRSGVLDRFVGPGIRGSTYLANLDVIRRGDVPAIRQVFSRRQLLGLFGARLRDAMETSRDSTEVINMWAPVAEQLYARLQHADFRGYLCEDLLAKVDRCSMAHSLEVRTPFLDHSVVEFAFAHVPPQLKQVGGRRKILLCEIARKHFPRDYDFERKQGFSIPLSRWLASEEWCKVEEESVAVLVGTLGASENLLQKGFRVRLTGEQRYALAMLGTWLGQQRATL